MLDGSLNAIHPYWVFKNELNSECCEKIINYGKKKWEVAKVGSIGLDPEKSKINKDIRITKVAWCNEQWLFDIVWHYINVANKNSNWNFQIDACEAMQITKYETKGHYDFHQDGNGFTRFDAPENKFINGKTRKLSMTIVLNENYEGGEFEFFDGKELIKEKMGTVIAFPSYLVHKVKPVIKGTRYSLVVWFCGEPFR
jgi:PKHD-type hydroxylase